MNNRNNLIDLLRIIAAVWVCLFHINAMIAFHSNWYSDIVYQGFLGVPIFFVISGYCIYYAAHHAKTSSSFIIRRLFRIYPAYWLSLIITICCLIAYKLIHGSNPVHLPKTAGSILETITLLSNPFSALQNINYVSWTLTYEIFFYLLVFIGLLLPPLYRLLWMIVISIAVFILPQHDNWPLFFIQYWPYFCLGMIIFRLLHCIHEYFWLNMVLLALTIAGFFFIATPAAKIITGAITGALIIINHYKPLKSNWLSSLGDYSYAIYLIHIPVCIYLLGDIKETKLLENNLWLSILWDMALVALTIFLSKLVYKYVELPFIQKGKNMADKYQKAFA